MLKKIIPVEDAISVLHDGDVLATAGYGGHGVPEQLLVTLERRFLETGTPRGLTLIHSTGQGDAKDKGLNHLAHDGLLKRVIGGHFGLTPKIVELVLANRIEAYNLPEGVITHLYRDIAAGKPGTLSKVGLGTFVDPRIEGGRMNQVTRDDLVTLMTIDDEEYLFYKATPISVAFIRGTTADPDGNITMEHEALILENLAMAIAARNSRGYVICQVERIAAEGTLDSRHVRIPGALVDAVVIAEPQHHMQTWGIPYNPALSGEVRIPTKMLPPLPLDDKKVIARRAAMELLPGSVVNLGIGIPDNIGRVANEERIHDLLTLTVDPGVMGGVPASGPEFGAAINCQAMVDHSSQFDFVERVAQITFSGALASNRRKDVLYVTERCVFRLTQNGLTLVEIAPGIDVERDILRHLPFRPVIQGPALMYAAIFRPPPIGLRDRMLDINIEDRLSYDPVTNTVFMNYSGMRVRSEEDIKTILVAVDRLLEPLGRRVNSIVNYEGFSVDDDAMHAYMDAVKYVERKYYLKVSRFTNSGFLRLKFAKELEKRQLTSRVFETRREADHNIAGEHDR